MLTRAVDGLPARPRTADRMAAGGLCLLALLALAADLRWSDGGVPGTTAARMTAAVLLGTLPLAWRRSWPWPVFGATVAADALFTSSAVTDSLLDVASGVALYTVALYRPLVQGVIAGFIWVVGYVESLKILDTTSVGQLATGIL